MLITSKLPNTGISIFAVMSGLANEYNAINLSQGFPNFDGSKKLQNLVHQYIQKGQNQYAPMAGVPVLREIIAQKIKQLYNADIDANTDITLTAGATQAIYTAINALIHAGDEVIIIEPAYDSYYPAVVLQGGIPVTHQLRGPNFQVDWDELRQLITDKTRMIIINSPHNPTGRIFSEADMVALQSIVKETDILILSDEVYEHLVFDGKVHQSILKFPELRKRSIATFSFGKTFHHTGWKLGYAIAPKELMQEFQKIHQFTVFCVNTPMQHAIAEYMQDANTYLSLPDFYQKKRDLLLEVTKNSRLRPLPCEGTYYQLYDYSELSDEKDIDFAKRITKEKGVATIPISPFCHQRIEDRVVRVCFAKTEETIRAAGEILSEL